MKFYQTSWDGYYKGEKNAEPLVPHFLHLKIKQSGSWQCIPGMNQFPSFLCLL